MMLIRSNLPVDKLKTLMYLIASDPSLCDYLHCLNIIKNSTLGIYEDFTITVESENLEFLQKVIDVCKEGEDK